MGESKAGAPEGNHNRLTHAVYAVKDRGPEALPAHLRDRELEFLGNIATRDGILRELEASARRQWCICEAGYVHLCDLMQADQSIWAAKDGKPVAILKILGSYENGLVRTLAKLSELRRDKDTIDLDTMLSKGTGDAEDTGN